MPPHTRSSIVIHMLPSDYLLIHTVGFHCYVSHYNHITTLSIASELEIRWWTLPCLDIIQRRTESGLDQTAGVQMMMMWFPRDPRWRRWQVRSSVNCVWLLLSSSILTWFNWNKQIKMRPKQCRHDADLYSVWFRALAGLSARCQQTKQ